MIKSVFCDYSFVTYPLLVEQRQKVWVKTLEVEISRLEGKRSVAIVGDAPTFSQATDIDYFITNVNSNIVTP